MQEKIYVSKNDNSVNNFTSVTEAIQSIPKDNQTPVTIYIAPGIYHEKITIDRSYVTLEGIGESNKDTILTYDDYAFFIMEDGLKRGTFRSYSVFIDAHDVTLKNLTIENASGDSLSHGQGIALYADGDRLVINSCNIIGHQDTLFTGPLPPKEIIKNGFIGPKQFAPRIHGRQYYTNCYICGDVDFIFGSATAYFENCTIESLRHVPEGVTEIGKEIEIDEESGQHIQGYITAASTPEGEAYGYVFSECHLISNECPQETVYLGRPWRDYAKTVFIDCDMADHIHPKLFHDWNKENARKNVLYGVYDSELDSDTNSDADEAFSGRADFVKKLSSEEAGCLTKERVLSGSDGWLA
ncbi:MAG: pectin methylesterase [Lachnospiraceae bacterium]|nr:pectin methylesterase [Lachnospiraceae bacterium]